MSYIGNVPYQVAFVSDTFSGDGTTTAFTMSVAPANTSSVLVAITGVLQSPSTYSVSGTTLTFSAAPPTGTGNISVRYLGIPASGVTTTAYRTVTDFTATAGQTTFTPPSYTVGFINVYRNGSRLGSADYTATNGTTVVLASAASSGDLVTVESFLVSSVLNAIPATAGSVGSTYIASGAVGTTQLASGAVTQSILGTGVAGNGPAFSAYPTTTQSISSGVNTKILFDTKLFDTNTNFASSRFTPTVAGYYQINVYVELATPSGSSYINVYLYKTGSTYSLISETQITSSSYVGSGGSELVYCNGSTDYLEIYIQTGINTTVYGSTPPYTRFSGFLARSA